MTRTSIGLAIAVLSLTTACGADDRSTAERSSVEQQAPAPDAAGSVLTAVVGTEADPDAFTVTLTDDAGAPVTTLPAGEYTVQVSDLSSIHNAHLTGPGVDESTTVPEVTETTWEVTLEAGQHTLVCDPHPKMKVTFDVT